MDGKAAENAGANSGGKVRAGDTVRAADMVNAKTPLTPMQPRYATKANSRYVPGRRDWIKYLDTGVAEASRGRMRATVTAANGAMPSETGWHYHECEMQLGFITKGWIEMQFEDGSEVRFEAGDVMFIPGGVKHNEIRTSDDIAGMEVTVPADMGTVPCDPPAGWKART
jgi:quercetin dioxygenase-like cupin family protein